MKVTGGQTVTRMVLHTDNVFVFLLSVHLPAMLPDIQEESGSRASSTRQAQDRRRILLSHLWESGLFLI